MFVPRQYREPNGSWITDLIRRNPLALLVSSGDAAREPHATHLPVIEDPKREDMSREDLSGSLLFGHMNVQNPHWAALEDGCPVLLVFTGPHAYVSPTTYGTNPAAPTWNFTSVHVHGAVQKVDSREETLDIVRSTVHTLEKEFGAGWDMTHSVGYFRRILPGVGAFRVRVTSVEGMFKLSQEQDSAVRDRVRRDFAGSTCTLRRDTAHLMDRLPDGRPSATTDPADDPRVRDISARP
ncbi:FMN-binding negative transcriptional regulator [Streptomyces rubiginosohelvolus]